MSKELSADTTLSHYRIVAKIGAGGMGEVYLAQDTKLDRKVALKILPADLAANHDRMRRFVQEAKAAAALNHPNIAHIYEIGESDGTNFIAMEFVDGETLREKIQGGKSELKLLLKHLLQVAEGLAKAHASGIVHRDLKPDNIMVTGDGHAKILDFGLAKLVETGGPALGQSERGEAPTAVMQQHSVPGVIMGTIGYMSPEQAQAKPVDQRSDIFSFGCVLYEAATGRKPFAGDSIFDTLHKIIYEPAPAITDYNPSASPELQRVIRKCLAKEPEKRYQTIRDTANDIEELLEEMKGTSDIERSVAPSTSSTTSATGSTDEHVRAQSTATVTHPTASSAEYIFAGVKQHKFAAAIALLVLVVGAVGLGLYLRAPNSEGAIDSIAVLPFQNKSSDADTEYLSDGLAESLIYRLSQLPNLKVSPTTSVMRYKGKDTDAIKIGNELGVNAVMSGRIAQRGENLAISIELVDVRNNKLLWGEKYERKMTELLATQREITAEITNKLQLKLSGNEKGLTKRYTDNNEAYQLYLKGRFYLNKRDETNLRKAIEQFKAAVGKDPNYALAFVGLADSYGLLPYYSSVSSTEVLPQAKGYAVRALEIDDSMGEAHASLGYVHRLLWNWHEMETELKRAIELNPNYATAHKYYGNYLANFGRFDEALAAYKRAQELDPVSLIINANVAEVYLSKGDLNAAVEQCQRTIDLDPNWYYVRLLLALVYVKQGLNVEALAEAEKSGELSKRQSAPLGVLGYVYARAGKRGAAATVAQELEARHAQQQANGFDLARLYVGLGDKDQAFAWLEKDFQSRNATMPGFLYMPPLDSLSNDPRFKDLSRRMGLPELK